MGVAMENRWKRRLMEENNATNARKTEREALRIVRAPRTKQTIARDNGPTRGAVRRWMRLHAGEYETATHLAEAANAALDLPQEWLDDPSHWVWDEALREHEGG